MFNFFDFFKKWDQKNGHNSGSKGALELRICMRGGLDEARIFKASPGPENV